MTLKSRVYKAVRWTTFGAAFNAFLKLIQIAVLARLLAPEDFGLMAMATVVLSLASLFSDLGLSSAYLQKRNVTIEQRSSLFWANIFMSSGLTLFVLFTSSFIADFFAEPRFVPILMLSSPMFLISALSQQIRIAAQKELEFLRIVTLESISSLTGFIVSIIMALQDFGVFALVWGSIANALTGTVLSWVLLSRGWRPFWSFEIDDIRPFLAFGGATVGNNIINQLNNAIDLLLGARMLAASQLGLYSLPRNFILQIQFMVNPIITRVGFPLIAEVQHDIARVKNIYLKTLNMTSSTNAPVYVGLAFFSQEAAQILLGSGWADVDDLLKILAIWGLVRSIPNPVGSLLLGLGRAGLALKWNLLLLFIGPPILWFGSTFGVNGLAWSLLGFHLLLFLPVWAILVRPLCHASFFEYITSSLRPALIALFAIAPCYYLLPTFNLEFLRLVVAIIISTINYLVISYFFNRDWFTSMLELTSTSIKRAN